VAKIHKKNHIQTFYSKNFYSFLEKVIFQKNKVNEIIVILRTLNEVFKVLNLYKRILHLFLCFNKIKQRNNLLKQRNIMNRFLIRKSLLILKKRKRVNFFRFL
jgi:hypothetical protein